MQPQLPTHLAHYTRGPPFQSLTQWLGPLSPTERTQALALLDPDTFWGLARLEVRRY